MDAVVASSSSFMSQTASVVDASASAAGERRVRLRLAFGGTFVAVSPQMRTGSVRLRGRPGRMGRGRSDLNGSRARLAACEV
jgi:hypothetical protein